MLNAFLSSPYAQFGLAGIAAGVVALLRSKLRNKPPTERQRRLDAALCGIGALGICWLAWRLVPDRFSYEDSIPYGIAIGFLGAGRIYEMAFKRLDPHSPYGEEHHNDKN